jgi:hypothetical protein
MRAFNMFSHSTSNLDKIGKRNKRSLSKSQSTMSLNSIESQSDMEAEKDGNKSQVVEMVGCIYS